MNKQLISLISKHNGKTLKFRQLPKEAKCAMSHYMSIDGEAWKYPEYFRYNMRGQMMGKEIAKNIDFYIKLYGNLKFGFVKLPTKEFLSLFCAGKTLPKKKHLYEKRNKIWPIILEFTEVDGFNPLPIQDGWHRLSDYVTMGLKKIPCLYYLKKEKYY